MGRVAVKPDLLRWARDRAGKDVEELRGKFPQIDAWEAEEVRPTLKQLERYAKATRTPFGYFFLAQPPEEHFPIPYFRTERERMPHRPSPDLLETIQTMQRRQEWFREWLVENESDALAFVGAAHLGDAIETVAARMRDALGFPVDWARALPTWTQALRTLRDAMDTLGVVVVTNGVVGNNTHRKLDPDEFRGFVLVDGRAPLVFVNGADAKAAQMFTLAHELAHLWFGQSAAFDLKNLEPADNQTERACNAVAAEFLVAGVELRAQWDRVRRQDRPFDQLARHFKVSAIVAARRALDLGLINRQAFFQFYEDHIAAARRKTDDAEGGGDFYLSQNVRLGRRFAVAVVQAVQEGQLAYRDAYTLTGLWGRTFDNYVADLQGRRRRRRE
jgi:Zn-dependent peptidase ImmA (M78 family)